MRKSITALLCLLCVCFVPEYLYAQSEEGQVLPQDSSVVTGRLANGITYYLRGNANPRHRANFYIIRDVGALVEEEHQNGLAHFLEHMVFQGTKNFPGKSMMDVLEKHGVSFGTNVNAYTGQTETVYNINMVPTGQVSLLDTCLLMLHDWSYYLTLDSKEIDSERNVIVEEWRTRRTPSFRIQDKTRPLMFAGSRYADRDVIGSLDVIRNFQPQTLRDFYRQWYRTDLEAIVVVGDFNVKRMESKVKALFSDIPSVNKAWVRPFFSIPDHQETRYVLATDKEATRSSLSLTIRFKDAEQKNTSEYLKHSLLVSIYNSLMKNRISNQRMLPDAPFLGGNISFVPLVKGYNAYSISVTAHPNEEARAWKAILTENERVCRFGFTSDELKRVKRELLSQMEMKLRNSGREDNDTYAQAIRQHYLNGEPLMDARTYYRLAKPLISAISADDLRECAKRWNAAVNRTIIVTGPSEGINHLTEKEAKEILTQVKQLPDGDIRPYADISQSGALITEDLKGGEIVASKTLPQFDAVEWTLSNGAKVVFKHTPYTRQSIMLSSYSPGGTSLYGVDLLPAAENAGSMVPSFGLGNYTPVALRKMMTGKAVSTQVSIGAYSESVGGSAALQDLETLFQTVYLHFEHPRFDEELFAGVMKHNYRMQAQSAGTPQQRMQDSLLVISTGHHPRSLAFDKNYLDAITLQRLEQVYRDRIRDASDFTFFIVGCVDEARIRLLVEKYLGSLQSEYRKESWKNHRVYAPKGKTVRKVSLPMETPKSTVLVSFSKRLDYTARHNVCLYVLQHILQTRCLKNIREKEGGTYGVNVNCGSVRIPEAGYTVNVQFDCDPDKAERLKSLVYAETERLAKEAPSEDEVLNAVEQLKKNDGQIRNQNSYWMSAIANYYIDGINMTDPANFEYILDRLEPQELRKFAGKLFKKADIVDLIFSPEEK